MKLRTDRCEVAVLGAAGALLVSALLMLLTPASRAQESRDVAALLEKMAGAEHATYSARQLVVYFGRPQSAAVLDVRSSSTGHFVRAESGDAVRRLWRRAKLGLVSDGRRTISDAAPPSVPLLPRSVLAKYEVEIEQAQTIVGVDVVPLVLVRRNDRKTVERWWVHEGSGLVYRRELYGLDGKLVGMSTVLDMHWGERQSAEPVEPSATVPARVATARSTSAPDMLPNGYRLLETYRMESQGGPHEHWVYSDGLHALSVFRHAGGMRAPEGFVATELAGTRAWAGPGPGTWAWEGGGASWVIVAEEPALDPVRLTEVFPRGGPSVWSRLGSLWARGFRAVAGLLR